MTNVVPFRSAEEVIEKLEELSAKLRDDSRELDRAARTFRPGGPDINDVLARIQSTKRAMRSVVETYGRYPTWHEGHFTKLQEFDYDNSVFIMTKFPDDSSPVASDLQTVIDLVRTGIEARDFLPRVASDNTFHNLLWANVELYMLACRRGVVIVEDKSKDEFNPNVTMEWGWMLGMGREILFLKERKFGRMRADQLGMNYEEFDWKDPKPGIEAALDKWLGNARMKASTLNSPPQDG